jgi:hypothetical protein
VTTITEYALTASALFQAAERASMSEAPGLLNRARRLAIRAADLAEHDQPEDAP